MLLYKNLKELTWEDDWKKYISMFFNDMSSAEIIGILNLMHEFKKENYNYTVYEAFLKASEIKASSYSLNCDKTILQRLIRLKKMDIKNIKKGIFNSELKEYITVLEKGYKEWLECPYSPY